MTKYQIARCKRAVKRDLTKEILGPQAHNYKSKVAYCFPKQEDKKLPDYIANNPWY